jgi:biotin carboxyl carrier protein
VSREIALRHAGASIAGRLTWQSGAAVLEWDGRRLEAAIEREGPWIEIRSGDRVARAAAVRDAAGIWVAMEGRVYLFEVEHRHAAARDADVASGDVRAPMTGRVAAVEAAAGATVAEGDLLLTIEAMKMEFKVAAPAAGAVEILCEAGDRVELGQLLARVAPHSPQSPQFPQSP